MRIFAELEPDDFEQIIVINQNRSGLRALIAIHDTTRGPALGGTRLRAYPDDASALADCMRLARAMSYKAALADLKCGGGKAVIMDHAGLKRGEAFEAFGAFVESLGGRFQTGKDLGTTDEDIRAMARQTRYVACNADADYNAALGIREGIKACLAFLYGDDSLAGRRVAIQGLGAVGWTLARLLGEAGAQLMVADLDESKVERARAELGAEAVSPEQICSVECDVFSPCAVGGVINGRTIHQLKAKIIAGSANNVLAEEGLGWKLKELGIAYAPDYLINAGALIAGYNAFLLGKKESRAEVMRIYHRTLELLRMAAEQGLPTNLAADEIARSRLKKDKAHTDLFWPRSRKIWRS